MGTATRSRLLPLPLRRRGYERFRRIGAELGLRVLVCACKNPDVEAEIRSAGRNRAPEEPARPPRQLSLF